ANPQSGSCTIDGGAVAGSSGGGGSSPIVSVFGRTGIVTSQAGDYSFSQLSGTVAPAQLAGGIDAGKISGGTVSSTAFGYLANVSGDIQAQINGKSAATHTHTVTGDVTGDLGSLVVSRIQTQPVAATPASDGQVLTWSAASGQWQPQTVASPSAGGNVPSTLGLSMSSATTLTIGANCSAAAPCNVGFGNLVQAVVNPATVTLTAGTGTAYIYVDQTGTVTVGHNLTLLCSSACQATSGVTAFPAGVIPIASWQATSGTWSQGTDWRAFLATKVVNAGNGIVV